MSEGCKLFVDGKTFIVTDSYEEVQRQIEDTTSQDWFIDLNMRGDKRCKVRIGSIAAMGEVND